MPSPNVEPLEQEDLVAVRIRPGPVWIELVARVWTSRAALFPVDVRLPSAEAAALLRKARPTVLVDADGARRLGRPGAVDAELALVVHTSGTGGSPKLAELDRAAVDAAVAGSGAALGASDADPWLCCLPLAHVGGLLVLLRAILLGAPVTVHERFDPRRIAAEREAVFTSLVPTMLVRLLDADADLRRFHTVLVGGAGLDPAVRERAARAGANVVETYGLTETLGGVVYDGRPLEGTSVRIGPSGEILLRGPTLLRGYRSDPRETVATFTEDGWLRTGDAGWLEARGRLRVTGRLDSAITTGGERVWPEAVEPILAAHRKVADVAVLGRPDPEWGQLVVAVVVPAIRADPPTLDELRDAVTARLPRYAAPRALVVATGIPRTSSGKIRRARLAADIGRAE